MTRIQVELTEQGTPRHCETHERLARSPVNVFCEEAKKLISMAPNETIIKNMLSYQRLSFWGIANIMLDYYTLRMDKNFQYERPDRNTMRNITQKEFRKYAGKKYGYHVPLRSATEMTDAPNRKFLGCLFNSMNEILPVRASGMGVSHVNPTTFDCRYTVLTNILWYYFGDSIGKKSGVPMDFNLLNVRSFTKVAFTEKGINSGQVYTLGYRKTGVLTPMINEGKTNRRKMQLLTNEMVICWMHNSPQAAGLYTESNFQDKKKNPHMKVFV